MITKPEVLTHEEILAIVRKWREQHNNELIDYDTWYKEITQAQRDKDWEEMLKQFVEWIKKHGIFEEWQNETENSRGIWAMELDDNILLALQSQLEEA